MNQPAPSSVITRPGPAEVRHLFFGTAALLGLAGLVALWDPAPSKTDRAAHAAVFGGLLIVLVAAGLFDAWRGHLPRRLATLPPQPSTARLWPTTTVALSAAVVVTVVLTVLRLRSATSHVTELASFAVVVGVLTLLLRIPFHAWDGRLPDRNPAGSPRPSARVVQVGDFVVTLGFVAMAAVLIAFPRVHSRDAKSAACRDSIARYQRDQTKILSAQQQLARERAAGRITDSEYITRLRGLTARLGLVNCRQVPVPANRSRAPVSPRRPGG